MLVILLFLSVHGCYLDLSKQRPPLTGATLARALRRAVQKSRCTAPDGLYLSDNQIESLPGAFDFTELAWSCSGNPFSDVEVTLDQCKSLCANNTQCAYISLLPTRCLLYSSDCNSTGVKNEIVANVTASYRKDATLADLDLFKTAKELDLSNNNFVEVPAGIGGLSQLTQLLLSSNQITKLPDYGFPRLTSLRYLKLNNNNLTNLTSGLFGPQLTDLILNHNMLSSFPQGVFGGLSNLRFLDFAYNKFSTLPPKVFSNLTSLSALYLDANPLATIQQGAFDGLGRLDDLRMESALVSSLPEAIFRPLTSLTYLSMIGWRQLTDLPPGLFVGLSNLQDIVMSGANLTSLPSELLRGLTKLEGLEFQGNPISSLPFDIFRGLSQLTRLDVGTATAACSNRITCAGQAVVSNKLRPFRVSPTNSPSQAPSISPTMVTLSPTRVPTKPPTSESAISKPLVVIPRAPSSSQAVRTEKEGVVDVRGTGFIVGITIGAVCFVLLVCLLCWCYWRRSSTKAQPASKDTADTADPKTAVPHETAPLVGDYSDVRVSNRDIEIAAETLPLHIAPASSSSSASIYNGEFTMDTPTPTLALLLPVFGKGARLYTAVKVLGKGNFGTAYLVKNPQGKLYVVKTLLCTDQNDALQEARALSLAPTNPHLLKILDFFFEGPQFCVVVNYCQGGSLQELVPQLIELAEVERILREIATGLEALHDAELIHRDLKPDNIFLLNEEDKTVVIGDMGMARSLDHSGYYSSSFGHLLYKAPEIDKARFSTRSDMYAVGCVGFELLSGRPLSEMYTMDNFVIGRATQDELDELLDSLPENRKDHVAFRMVRRLLVHDPMERLTAQQLKSFGRGNFYS